VNIDPSQRATDGPERWSVNTKSCAQKKTPPERGSRFKKMSLLN